MTISMTIFFLHDDNRHKVKYTLHILDKFSI